MENAQKIKLLRTLKILDGKLPEEIDFTIVENTLNQYYSIPKNKRGLNHLQKKVLTKYSNLFTKNNFNDIFKILNNLKNNLDKDKITSVPFYKKNIKILKDSKTSKKITSELKYFSHKNKIIFSKRIKNKKSALLNIKNKKQKIMIDLLGIRLVPEINKFKSLINYIEKKYNSKIAFSLNTHLYSQKLLSKKIGPYSKYYKAIHYYIPFNKSLNGPFLEIQIRMLSTDQWSKLHHSTIYKKNIPINKEIFKAIMKFGEIANVTDYYNLLKLGK